MKCENCNHEIEEPYKDCKIIECESGQGYNNYWGQIEYWYSGTFECPNCKHKFDYGDSSL